MRMEYEKLQSKIVENLKDESCRAMLAQREYLEADGMKNEENDECKLDTKENHFDE